MTHGWTSPIMEFIANPSVKKLWEAVQPIDALQMIWHLPQPLATTIRASYYGPMTDPWFDLLSWATSAVQITIASGVPRKPVHLDIRESTAFLAAYEASLIGVGNLDKLQQLIGDSDISWAMAPTIAVIHQIVDPRITPSQLWRKYTPGKPFSEVSVPALGMQILNFEVEPSDVQATQSPESVFDLTVVVGQGDNVSGPAYSIMDLRDSDNCVPLEPTEPEVSTSLLPEFNSVQSATAKEWQDAKMQLAKLQNAMTHLQLHASQQTGKHAEERNKMMEDMQYEREKHEAEIRALQRQVGSLVADLHAARLEVEWVKAKSPSMQPSDLPLLMGILKAFNDHPDLPPTVSDRLC